MRLPLCTLLALSVLAAFGIVLLRSTLLKNAYNTGTALSRNYAAEESNNLAVYQTLLTFGTASIDWRVEQGAGPEELREWMSSYFSQLNTVLGDGVVDPYMVLDGQILAANPWSGDGTYDVYSTEWYQKALAADGQVIFTNVYTDAIYQKPVITAAQRCQTSDTVMAFDILPEYFHFETVDLIPESSFFLCDSQGSIIYRQTALDVSEQEMQAYLNRVIRQIKNGELADATASIQDLDGQQEGCLPHPDGERLVLHRHRTLPPYLGPIELVHPGRRPACRPDLFCAIGPFPPGAGPASPVQAGPGNGASAGQLLLRPLSGGFCAADL